MESNSRGGNPPPPEMALSEVGIYNLSIIHQCHLILDNHLSSVARTEQTSALVEGRRDADQTTLIEKSILVCLLII